MTVVIVSRSEKTWKPPESVRIGPLPAHEAVETAVLGDHVLAGPEVEVVRVAEDDLGPERAHLVGVEHLHGRLRPDGHERGRAHFAVRGRDDACSRLALSRLDAEAHRISIASPNE